MHAASILNLRRWITLLAAASALLAFQAPAAAALPPIALGTLSSPQDDPLTRTVSGAGLQGSFEQIFTFSLSSHLALGGDFLWKNRSTSSIINFDATLTTTGGAVIASDSATSSVSSSFSSNAPSLQAGDYVLTVAGIGSGTNGGYFTVALSAYAPAAVQMLPVPEPGTSLMYGAGLLLIGTCITRRYRIIDFKGRISA